MIGFLRGQILEKHPNRLIVDVHGVGYDLYVPLSTYYQIGEEGSEVALRVYTHVREEALQLYGFLTDLERQLFERLIGISGIGPKLAISVLSGIDTRELVDAVQRADVVRLTRIPGIGKKTAERIVLELKGKLASEDVTPISAGVPADRQAELTARDALVELGYSVLEAEQALAGIDPALPAEERVRLALRQAA